MNNGYQNQNPYYQYNFNTQPQYRGIPQLDQQLSPYIMQQTPNYLKGRPVASFDEARASQVDLDGSLYVFPDIGNKKIYTKQIMPDGTVSLLTYIKEENLSANAPEYVTKEQFEQTMDKIRAFLQKNSTPEPVTQSKKTNINF